MSNAAALLVHQALQRYAADCRAASARLHGAQRLVDVVRLADVHRPSIVASIAHCAPEGRQLEAAAQRRVQEICEAHLVELRRMQETGDHEGFDTARGRFRQEMQCLRGHFPLQLQLADRELQRLEHAKDRPQVSRPNGPAGG